MKVWTFNDPKELDDPPQAFDDPREFQLKVWSLKVQKSTVTVTVAVIPPSLMVLFSLAIPMEIFSFSCFRPQGFCHQTFPLH